MRDGLFRKNRGFTLIEVILSIAIIGIIAVAFIPVFTAGFKSIVYVGGQKTKMFNAQDTLEKQLANDTNTGTDNITIIFPADEVSVQYDVYRSGQVVTDDSYILFSTKID